MAISVLDAARRRKRGDTVKIRLSAGLLVLVVTLAVAAAGFGRTTAIVKLGGLCDLSGPTSDVGVSYCKGELDYVTYFNRKGGFSNKAKANISLPDFAYNVAKAQQLYAQITSGNPVAFMGWGTADTTALGPQITRDKLPFMSASLAEQLTNPKDTPYNFVAGTNYTAQAQIAAKYIDRTTSGHKEIAFFHNNSAFGTAPIAGLRAYIDAKNFDFTVTTYPMITGTTAFDAQLLQAKSRGADYIFIQNVPTPASILAKDVKRLGLTSRIVCLNYCASEVLLKLAGDAANGMMGIQPFTPVTFNVPGNKAPAAFLKARGSSLAEQNIFYLQGWYTMAVMLQGIDTLIKGQKAITGPNLKVALETMPEFLSGGVGFPIKFKASGSRAHDGMKGSRVYSVKSGRFTKLTGFVAP